MLSSSKVITLAFDTVLLLQISRKDFLEAMKVLEVMHRQWRNLQDLDGSKVPPSEFQNLEISDSLDLSREYMEWTRPQVRSLEPCFRSDEEFSQSKI